MVSALQPFTPARVALGRAGSGQLTGTHLQFQLDHACARDAVHDRLPIDELAQLLRQRGWRTLKAHSKAKDRSEYLRRPDLGRMLSEECAQLLSVPHVASEIGIVVADGLSASAVAINLPPLLDELRQLHDNYRVGPLVLVEQGRVAIGDEIGERLGCQMIIMLIGERPGLSAADSLGAYLTWHPRVGTIDANRHCISNIRPAGLTAAEAAGRISNLITHAFKYRKTGVRLNAELAALSQKRLPSCP